eukprot:SAG11_NODE_26228_length_348_cov_0.618474_1_plen_30_part_10
MRWAQRTEEQERTAAEARLPFVQQELQELL